MDDYRQIADTYAIAIAQGKLKPGDRLPPQREFARAHGIASSTATRVYSELKRRGLVVGETGRGTFVRAVPPSELPALTEPAQAPVDLELNFSVLPGQAESQAESLTGLLRPDVMDTLLRPTSVTGTPLLRAAAAKMLARAGWEPDPASVVFTGNGRQAIAVALDMLVPNGGRLGVEPLTYPVIKGLAARRGITLVPLPMDEHGLRPAPADLESVHAVYMQPTLHNPLGVTMPRARREELARVLDKAGVPVIEDNIYGFLADDHPPVAPHRTVMVDSLSKRLSPGLTLGFIAPPPELASQTPVTARAMGLGAQHFAMQAATRWLTDGVVERVCADKRVDAKARQEIARACLPVEGDPGAYHCWWRLPDHWTAEAFVTAAARQGIAIAPATAFTVAPGNAPRAVRLSLSAPPLETLRTALATLKKLADTSDPYETVEP
ncbi:PLP-dependent aminotransferase family protein [Kibdelosporangium phytohabitans]|uniref:GntR family transcriptional regulator n=1 Tax=Kibdelosporangium phytohabitans TaxID=860235 RepID=A0A0N7F317_9PSEU|nr:PLP-dependent aminotransferase family protein [Kibdelosporangium phytohabitans]ALG07383.1 GntR family transcriptional regulator [Kibdelosporangium phytohabitans]MBE1471735.1 DNA-binding transcriptional MocR family regulator [Kibdelosporangium phytohabitans]